MEDNNITQKEALERAKIAAINRDVVAFLGYLHASRFMDGAKRRLKAIYNAFDDERIHEILTVAADRLYEAIIDGKKIIFPAPYLWKIIINYAQDIYRSADEFKSLDEKNAAPKDGVRRQPTRMIPLSSLEYEPEEARNARIEKGLEIAKSLLPKIGNQNVQQVMAYYIDAVAAGVEDVTAREVSEALGITESSVSKWKQRGIERLRRAAVESGYSSEYLEGFGNNEDIESSDAEDE